MGKKEPRLHNHTDVRRTFHMQPRIVSFSRVEFSTRISLSRSGHPQGVDRGTSSSSTTAVPVHEYDRLIEQSNLKGKSIDTTKSGAGGPRFSHDSIRTFTTILQDYDCQMNSDLFRRTVPSYGSQPRTVGVSPPVLRRACGKVHKPSSHGSWRGCRHYTRRARSTCSGDVCDKPELAQATYGQRQEAKEI